MWKRAFKKIWSDMVCLGRPHQFKFFKGCFPQILLGPFFNTLSQLFISLVSGDISIYFNSWIFIYFPCYLFADPLNTGRKLEAHKTFRRRAWRLLNFISALQGELLVGHRWLCCTANKNVYLENINNVLETSIIVIFIFKCLVLGI